MASGTKVADICYEYFDGTEKRHRKIGSIYYYRNHSGGTPSAQVRLDVIPSNAWAKNPETYFIGNFIESEKIPEAPFICGDIYVPSDKRGERTYIGHICTRETDDGSRSQFYLQINGLPLREFGKLLRKKYQDAVREAFEEFRSFNYSEDIDPDGFVDAVDSIVDTHKRSVYLSVDME